MCDWMVVQAPLYWLSGAGTWPCMLWNGLLKKESHGKTVITNWFKYQFTFLSQSPRLLTRKLSPWNYHTTFVQNRHFGLFFYAEHVANKTYGLLVMGKTQSHDIVILLLFVFYISHVWWTFLHPVQSNLRREKNRRSCVVNILEVIF